MLFVALVHIGAAARLQLRLGVYGRKCMYMNVFSGSSLLKADGLAIMRGERVLFRDMSLEAGQGEAVILRGANGAGKTTLLRILAGLTQAELGEVARPAAFHWIGHKEGLKPDETPSQHLRRWAQAWGSNAEIETIVGRMALSRTADVPARLLSAGQRRRVALGRLLLEERPLWLLDEPLTALDRDGKALVLEMIAAHRASGGAVIAAIHGEAGFAADREVMV